MEKLTPEFSNSVFTHILAVPLQLEDPAHQRVYVEWRGLALSSPVTLEAIEPEQRVPILRGWRERGIPVLRLAHPTTGAQVDYCVRWLCRTSEGQFAVVELPSGLLSQELLSQELLSQEQQQKITLVQVLNHETLRTLTVEEFLRGLSEILSQIQQGVEALKLEDVFGPMPDWLSPEFRAQQEQTVVREVLCFHCEKPVQEQDCFCPHCGVSRTAPLCPECGKAVTGAKDRRVFYQDENGRYPWHFSWNGRCAGCGFSFEANLELETGHHTFFAGGDRESAYHQAVEQGRNPFAGQSQVEIQGGESVYMVCDDWDHQPTIEVRIKRSVGANMNSSGGALSTEEHITMTLEECEAIFQQIHGPLKVLMARKKWSRDTT